MDETLEDGIADIISAVTEDKDSENEGVDGDDTKIILSGMIIFSKGCETYISMYESNNIVSITAFNPCPIAKTPNAIITNGYFLILL